MRKDFNKQVQSAIDALKEQKTYKTLKHIMSSMSRTAYVDGLGDEIILCSNNYLGLADKKEIIDAGINALEKYGSGASSVRFICGTFDIHRQLEEKVAEFLNMEASLTYSSCYAANTGSIAVLLSEGDAVISDELNHASIIDGCRMVSKAVTKLVYKHSHMESLEEKLKETKDCGTVIVVTDGVFSMEGDIAPLKEIIALCKKYGAVVMIDESHATGVIGKTGRGTMEYWGITEGVDIISGTFGKALGGAGGGFIAAKKSVCDLLVQKSRPHLFSNALPPVLCGIALASIEFLESNPQIVESLQKKSVYARAEIKKAGLNPLEGDSAIIPIIVNETSRAIRVSEKMLELGVYAIGFGFPVVKEGEARIRLQISDALTYDDIDTAVKIVAKCVNEG